MKTKYIAVPVSERLPEKEGIYPVIFNLGGEEIVESVLYNDKFGFHAENTDCRYVDEWLEEKEDHSEEMLYVLEDVKNKFKPSLSHPLEEGQEEFINQIEQLINKVKDNGK
ncbi:hypothetical protein J2O09_05505 [Elizabethkingia anophelis]|uniref:hypothetical protein n=1 Tax=Elizabethkingia anophelis TaxID=1117645 RepID=UPI0020B90175|nr:hypothetical protein [Elizabethkingia anophelis]UTG62412.1 hypothetical protein J2O09_05505 [Elizabethkingia anophelis]UXM68694.1 hypothetical protein N7E57_05515 [Elizabethkingia anophelis]